MTGGCLPDAGPGALPPDPVEAADRSRPLPQGGGPTPTDDGRPQAPQPGCPSVSRRPPLTPLE